MPDLEMMVPNSENKVSDIPQSLDIVVRGWDGRGGGHWWTVKGNRAGGTGHGAEEGPSGFSVRQS